MTNVVACHDEDDLLRDVGCVVRDPFEIFGDSDDAHAVESPSALVP